jgi:nucleoside-diphosphate-sugar epimerase
MSTIKVIITGATGMVGEGVLLECIQNKKVSEILLLSRRNYEISHPKVKQLIVRDFFNIEEHKEVFMNYDACFFCAGISSIGMKEPEYTRITYDTTLHVAKVLSEVNQHMTFTYVSGQSTDSSENGKMMWARVKGKTENDLMKLKFKGVYNFRPGYMHPFKEQKNVKPIFKFFGWFVPKLIPKQTVTLSALGIAMINCTFNGFSKHMLEIKDIHDAAKM